MPRLQNIVLQLMEEAKESTLNALHCAALLGKGNKIIALNTNSDRTRIGKKNCCSAHAEDAVLRRFERGKLKDILRN